MWWTPTGERTLTGAEGALFREALASTVDHALMSFGDDDSFEFAIFNRLDGNARLALLAEVGAGLLREDVPKRELNSLNETAIAVTYDEIETEVAVEIDTDVAEDGAEPLYRTTWRQRILDACREEEIGTDDLPAVDCDDHAEWSILIESLRDTILWDEDWLEEAAFLDVDPDLARARKHQFGIADDYFRAIPPDPTEREFEQIRDTLRDLTGCPVIFMSEDDFSLIGFEDLYHGVLVGPCGEETASRESQHPLVLHIEVASARDFDLNYHEWFTVAKPSLSGVTDVLQSDHQMPAAVEDDVRVAVEAGLPGGERIEQRDAGWVVVDESGLCLIADPAPIWTDCADGEESDQPSYFGTPEAALAGLRLSEIVQRVINERRDVLLKRFGRQD